MVANAYQAQIYREHANEHPFLAFVRSDWQKELLRKQLEGVESTGFINAEQILVGKPDENGIRRLIFVDWAGGGDPFPLGGATNPLDQKFKESELEGLTEGFELILQTQSNI